MRDYIKAKSGMIYTNGVGVDGEIVYVGDGIDVDSFYEIPREEYDEMMESPEATENDYLSALREMGVGV